MSPAVHIRTLEGGRGATQPVSGGPSPAAKEPVLCVDLDGTLTCTDSLWEACLSLVLGGWSWLLIPFWLLRGKAYLKRRVAQISPIDVSRLPYHEGLVRELRDQRAAGRRIVLCTGADEVLAAKVAAHLGIFDDVIASNGVVNLVGARKRRALEERFGRGGFDYIGDSRKDIPVWQAARNAYVFTASAGFIRALTRRHIAIAGQYSEPRSKSMVSLWIRAMRLHQWAKNLLVFVPLALSHTTALGEALVAFLAFGLVASSAYLLNDLLDLAADRKHPHKKMRPFASGQLPLAAGVAALPLLWLAALTLSMLLPPQFAIILSLYLLATLSYSLWLKRYSPIDVILLAGLYTLRIMAGGAAISVVISPWTLAVSVFLFLSLAMVKRVSELRASTEAETASVPGRNYMKGDIQQLSSLGGAAGYISIVVMALYINSSDVQKLYARPQWLWLILPILLYWISRIWLLAHRGYVNQDPVVFALKDKATYVAGSIGLAIAVFAAM